MIRYQATLIRRKYQSDTYEEVYHGLKYWDTYDEAEEDALDNRCHPKEQVKIIEIRQPDNHGIILK